MKSLREYSHLDIDWDLAPEDAVTLYLEWGNNNWRSRHGPVRSDTDTSVYFVVDTWEEAPVIRLIQRNAADSRELVSLPMPGHLLPSWRREHGNAKGVFAPGPEVIAWLKNELEA